VFAQQSLQPKLSRRCCASVRMLCRITQSSDAHRTESVSVSDHEQTMGVNSRVLDQKQHSACTEVRNLLIWPV